MRRVGRYRGGRGVCARTCSEAASWMARRIDSTSPSPSKRHEARLFGSARTGMSGTGKDGLLTPHEALNLPGLRSGLCLGAPHLQVGQGGPWAVPSRRRGATFNQLESRHIPHSSWMVE